MRCQDCENCWDCAFCDGEYEGGGEMNFTDERLANGKAFVNDDVLHIRVTRTTAKRITAMAEMLCLSEGDILALAVKDYMESVKNANKTAIAAKGWEIL